MPKDERIGGSESYQIVQPGELLMPDRSDTELLAPVVLRELLITQRGLQDEARGITTVLGSMAVSLGKIEVKVEPMAMIQKDLTAHENRLTKVEQQAADNRESFDKSFRLFLALLSGVTGVGGGIFIYILSHIKWG